MGNSLLVHVIKSRYHLLEEESSIILLERSRVRNKVKKFSSRGNFFYNNKYDLLFGATRFFNGGLWNEVHDVDNVGMRQFLDASYLINDGVTAHLVEVRVVSFVDFHSVLLSCGGVNYQFHLGIGTLPKGSV